jgi:hypothetical protein
MISCCKLSIVKILPNPFVPIWRQSCWMDATATLVTFAEQNKVLIVELQFIPFPLS